VRTFGNDILHFARTPYHVDDQVWGSVISLVEKYLGRELHIEAFELLIATKVDNERGLGSYWHPGAMPWSSRLKTDGQYCGQVSYSFDRNLDMWVVAVDGGLLLRNPHGYRDLLENAPSAEIPPYVDMNLHPRKIRTSILLPLHVPSHEVGLLNLESTQHLRPSSHMHEELRHIANAISELYVKRSGRDGRDDAITFLREQQTLPLRDGRTLFLAYSTGADDQVIGAIKELLNEKFDVNVIDWKADDDCGDIRAQIWDHISKSTVCICYLSEPDQIGPRFHDNPNVLFEAGIMYALTQNQAMTAWIPIREPEPPALIFDIATERMLIVKRDVSGRLNEPALRNELSRKLGGIVPPKRREQ
jgi:hypothetical protein